MERLHPEPDRKLANLYMTQNALLKGGRMNNGQKIRPYICPKTGWFSSVSNYFYLRGQVYELRIHLHVVVVVVVVVHVHVTI